MDKRTGVGTLCDQCDQEENSLFFFSFFCLFVGFYFILFYLVAWKYSGSLKRPLGMQRIKPS